jgi:hypothetical protein
MQEHWFKSLSRTYWLPGCEDVWPFRVPSGVAPDTWNWMVMAPLLGSINWAHLCLPMPCHLSHGCVKAHPPQRDSDAFKPARFSVPRKVLLDEFCFIKEQGHPSSPLLPHAPYFLGGPSKLCALSSPAATRAAHTSHLQTPALRTEKRVTDGLFLLCHLSRPLPPPPPMQEGEISVVWFPQSELRSLHSTGTWRSRSMLQVGGLCLLLWECLSALGPWTGQHTGCHGTQEEGD